MLYYFNIESNSGVFSNFEEKDQTVLRPCYFNNQTLNRLKAIEIS